MSDDDDDQDADFDFLDDTEAIGSTDVSIDEILLKKRTRQERNRESARECRLRKKIRQTQLIQLIAQKEAENLALRLKLKIGPEAQEKEEEDSLQITARLDSLLKEGASDHDIQRAIQEMQGG